MENRHLFIPSQKVNRTLLQLRELATLEQRVASLEASVGQEGR